MNLLKRISGIALMVLLYMPISSFAQQWCSENYKPTHSYDIRDSPDYGKTFTIYFFSHTKYFEDNNMYFTNIFKVTFEFYGRGLTYTTPLSEHLSKTFYEYLEENIEGLSDKMQHQTYGSLNCGNYDDLKKRLANRKEYAKGRGWNVKVMEQFTPITLQIKEGPREAPEQNISFDVIR
ncbi:MAG: hypothetical protein WDZ45_01305 [Flavobacteriaceae bacterium]